MGIPVATITNGGSKLPSHYELLTLEVRRELNRIPEASLSLLDGTIAGRNFEISDLEFFAPGQQIAIALRYEGETSDVEVFRGFVVRHAIDSGENTTLRIELKDACFKLTRTRRSAVYRKMTDAEVIRKILSNAGLKAGTVAPTKPKHEELVQYNATDWDFIVSRADVLGLAVMAVNGVLSVDKIALGTVQTKLEHGLGDVSELSLEIDGSSLWAEVKSMAWDAENVAPTAAVTSAIPSYKVGNLDAKQIATTLGGAAYTLLQTAPLTKPELQSWADARLLRSRYAMLKGRAVIKGDPRIYPLDTVQIGGVGKRFDGKTLVSAVTHKVDESGWVTELTLGLSPDWFARQPDIGEPPAAGLLPPTRGLQLATVAAYEKDPLGELRVKLKLLALPENQGCVWARLTSPDAGNNRGMVFRPEVGDEVVIGFLDDDPRQPIVLGSLFGSKNLPPAPMDVPDDKNALRSIISRAGTRIVFDDEAPSLTLETTSGGDASGDYKNQIVIDEKEQIIRIADQHGNEFTLDKNGITLSTKGDFKLEASGKVSIKGSATDIQ